MNALLGRSHYRKATATSLLLHGGFALIFVFGLAPPKKEAHHKILVRSVALIPKMSLSQPPLNAPQQAPALVGAAELPGETPLQPAEGAPTLASQAEEIGPAVAEPPPEPSRDPDPPPPAKSDLPAAAPAQPKAVTAKATHHSKDQPKQKPSPKPPSKQKKTSQTSPTQQRSAAPAAQRPSYNKALLSEALQRLDRSRSISTGGPKGGQGGGRGAAYQARSVGTLHAEGGAVGFVAAADPTDYEAGYEHASPEGHYIGDLIRRLQLNVRLPSAANIRVSLTISRDGSVFSVHVLGGANGASKTGIVQKLNAIRFAPFGPSFAGEQKHTFLLRLSNDLSWSLS